MKPVLALLTGLSGTGKSTLVRQFQEHPLDHWMIYDFDVGGLPHPRDRSEHLSWRTEETKRWLDVARQNAVKGKKTAVFGLSLYPSSIKKLPEAEGIDIHYGLLHAEHPVRRERILQREDTSAWQGEQEWYSQFYEEMKNVSALVTDTSNTSLDETVAEVRNWLLSI